MIKSPDEVTSPFDYVVCAHKAIDQESVAARLKPAINENTTIVIIQNGVGNEEAFRNSYPQSSIITCVVCYHPSPSALTIHLISIERKTWVGARQSTPGKITHTKSEDMQIGLFANPSVPSSLEKSRLDTFASLLMHGQTKFQVLEDMQLQRWEKVVWNVAWNSLTTLTLLDTQSWLNSSPDATPLTRKLMREVIDVGRKCGVELDYGLIDRLMDKINAMPGIGSSMQTDCLNKRPMEIDVILGFPVKKAKELGIETPILETIHTLVRAVDVRLRASL